MSSLQPKLITLDTHNDLDKDHIQALMQAHPLILIRGLPSLPKDRFLAFSQSLGETLDWSFGSVMELTPDSEAENYLFSHEAVPFHWDGAFFETPRWLLFNCIEAPTQGAGGETLFADGQHIWNNADASTQEKWKSIHLKYETDKKAHYGGAFESKLVQAHPETQAQLIRYAEPVETLKNPVSLDISGNGDKSDLINDLKNRLYSKANLYEHQWQEGDILIADNLRLMHGRNAFNFDTPRHIRRIQLKAT